MMLMRVDGKDFTGFTNIGLSKSIDTICDQFTITQTADQAFSFPIPQGAEIEFLIEDVVSFTGVVEKISGSYSATSYSVSAFGRDDTKAILKTDLKPKFAIRGPISLKNVIAKTLAEHDIDLEVVDETGENLGFTEKEVLTDDVGAKIFDFFDSITSKVQVLLSKNNQGQLTIIRPQQKKYTTVLKTLIDDVNSENNVVSAEFDFDESEMVREYNYYSQANITVAKGAPPNPLNGDLSRKDLVDWTNTSGQAINDSISDGECHKVSEHPSDFQESISSQSSTPLSSINSAAKWEANNARVKATNYSCIVPFLLIDGEPFDSGVIVRVFDEVAKIDSDMLITGVEYSASRDENGRATEDVSLTMTIPDGYGLDASELPQSKQNNRIGKNWKKREQTVEPVPFFPPDESFA